MSLLGRVLLLRPRPEQQLMITTYRRMGLDVVIADDPASALAGSGDHIVPVAGIPAAVRSGDLTELEEAVAAFHARYPLDALVTTLDSLLPTVGRLNRRLGLGGLDQAAGEHCFDRRLQRKAFQDARVRSARYRVVRTPRELREAARELGYPFVLKPAGRPEDGSVVRVRGPGELTAALEKVSAEAWPDGCLAEEYLEGPEITVEAVTFRGYTTVLAMSDKLLGPPPHFAQLGTVVPGEQSEAVRAEAARQTAAALEALGVTDGVTHTELRITPAGPTVLEVDGRVAGGYIADMVDDALRVNLYEQHWRALTGWAPRVVTRPRHHCAVRGLDAGRGRLRSVDLGRLPHWPAEELKTVRVLVRPGDELGPVTDSRDLRGWVVARGSDASAARRTADRMSAEIRFHCTAPT